MQLNVFQDLKKASDAQTMTTATPRSKKGNATQQSFEKILKNVPEKPETKLTPWKEKKGTSVSDPKVNSKDSTPKIAVTQHKIKPVDRENTIADEESAANGESLPEEEIKLPSAATPCHPINNELETNALDEISETTKSVSPSENELTDTVADGNIQFTKTPKAVEINSKSSTPKEVEVALEDPLLQTTERSVDGLKGQQPEVVTKNLSSNKTEELPTAPLLLQSTPELSPSPILVVEPEATSEKDVAIVASTPKISSKNIEIALNAEESSSEIPKNDFSSQLFSSLFDASFTSKVDEKNSGSSFLMQFNKELVTKSNEKDALSTGLFQLISKQDITIKPTEMSSTTIQIQDSNSQQQFSSISITADPTATKTPVLNASKPDVLSPPLSSSVLMGGAGWSEEISNHVHWLRNKDQDSASIQLHPQELGRLDINIEVKEGKTYVHFFAGNPEARELLQSSLPSLRDLMAQGGLLLAEGQVNQQRSGNSGQYSGPVANGENSSKDGKAVLTPLPHRMPLSSLNQIDYYA